MRVLRAVAAKAMALVGLLSISGGLLAQTLSADTIVVNWAADTQGGIASASSNTGSGFSPHSLNNGDRTGKRWGAGGGWKARAQAKPDWAQVMFDARSEERRVGEAWRAR